jgi:hypothetical protein
MASVTKQQNGRYLVRWWDPEGRQCKERFDTAGEARARAATVEADKARGAYIDPRAGRVRFRDHAEEWLSVQTFDDSTRERTETRLRVHILPTFGNLELRRIQPSTVQSWLRDRQRECAPAM